MSTIDPAQARAERVERLRSSPLRPAALTAVLVATGLAAAALGAGVVAMLDSMRISKLNGVFATWESRLDHLFWLFPVGLCATIALVLLSTLLARAPSAGRLRYPVVGPLPVAMVGIATGVTWMCTRLTAPVEVGVRTDPSFGNDETWGTTQWIWYRADLWWPVLAWALAVAALVVAVVVRQRHRARSARIAHLLEAGRIVPGEVTEALPVPSPGSAGAAGRMMVRFTDPQGTDRWVRPMCRISAGELPFVGAEVAVLCDPQAPADVRRIFVGPRGARAASEFERWLL